MLNELGVGDRNDQYVIPAPLSPRKTFYLNPHRVVF
jgi:hypothetical protein